MEGDTGDEKPPKTDDGATLAVGNGYHRDDAFDTLMRAFSIPETAHGVAYGMALATGRLRPPLKAKGTPKASGDETVTVTKQDVAAARRDFDYRVDEPYVGLLAATAVDNTPDEAA